MSNFPEDFPKIDWSVPPDPQEIAQLREMARLPLCEKLAWLEAAQEMVECMNAHREQRAQGEKSLPFHKSAR